jgi:glycosyltransferase involved in cell wall biosynthesis
VRIIGAGRTGTRARLITVWDRTIPERLGDPFAEVMHAVLTRRAVEDLAMAGDADVVHDHTFSGPLNASNYAELGMPTIVTVHGPPHLDLRAYYRALGVDISLVAISHRQRSLAPELNWVSTVHNGLHTASWPFSRNKGDYALWLGRYHPDKAPHVALQACHTAGVPLVLAGKCAEPTEKRYFSEVIEPLLGPDDKVMGMADAVLKRELLANARCLLFPVQWEEPFGMVMIEAMVCGTPVVALSNGAVPEVIVHGLTGLLCDQPEELPDALHAVTVLDSRDCRTHVERNFTARKMAAGYVRTYSKAVSNTNTESVSSAAMTGAP